MFDQTCAIGVDIGRNSIRIAVIRIDGEIIVDQVYPLSANQTKEYLISKLAEAIKGIRTSAASNGVNPICIGVSAKGFIEHEKGIVLGPDQGIDGWVNVPLASLLGSETGLPVFVGNDANMMTIAEHRFGAAKGFNNIIYVALRTGIGGGIIINGKLYRGMNNAGGEFGQMIIQYGSEMSDKGIRGSLEQLASSAALVKRYNALKIGSSEFSGEISSCREIFEMSYKNDPLAVKIVDENAYLVGIGLANLITIFVPEIIVIGGGMSEANDSYLTKIKESAFENSLHYSRSEVRIEKAKLSYSASILGSGYYSMIRLAGKII